MAAVRILGVDPGSRITGYGVIEADGPRQRWLAHGRIRCEDGPLPERLLRIFAELGGVIRAYAPQESAVESVFVNRNVSSAIVLGQARGAAICALASARLCVVEYAPAQVKSAIVGQGRAGKSQVQHMVKALLGLQESPPADAADALAVALCHAHLRTALPARGGKVSGGRWTLAQVAALQRGPKS
ncbi:MAG: crossover junction endodeoxyribonuclease RuvC [Nevskia sp.]|nr:crossover junction endodeoxyribonuclease RuvC [Nevskia sp.]